MSIQHIKGIKIINTAIIGVITKHIRYSSFSGYLKSNKLTNEEVRKKRVSLYDKEVLRQNSLITDIEKVTVNYVGLPNEVTLIMNKDLSNPYNCAQHINERVLKEAVVAEVNGEVWDMCRPLNSDCSLKFLHFREADPFYVNKAFWRSLSLMLGSILECSFKDDLYIELCSFPAPKVRSGSFVYDVSIPMESWTPTMSELRSLSGEMVKLALSNKPFQRLEVDVELALKMFEDNLYKSYQIPNIASKSESGSDVVLYRIGDFIDLSRGPAISHTGHMGKCSITAVYPLNIDGHTIYRVQGVALPAGFKMNHFTYGIIENRSKNINLSNTPYIEGHNMEDSSDQTAKHSSVQE